MRQAAKEAFESKLSNYKTMQGIVRAYVNKRECSVQEAVYHVLLELHLRKIFQGVCFANSNIPEECIKILKSETEFNMLPRHSTDVFKRNNVDRYISRPNKFFCHGRYQVLDSFCFAEFLAYYTPVSKNCKDQQHEYQPNVLPDQLIEKNHEACAYPKTTKLMNWNETMKCRKVRRVLRYHVPNKDRYPDKFAHHLLFMFYPLRSEDELLTGNPPTYQNTLACPSVLSAVNKKRQKFEPYADILEETFANFNHNLESDQDSYGQI